MNNDEWGVLMTLVVLKELEYYTANVDYPYKESDLIVRLGLENDIKRYHSIIKELKKTTFFKSRKPSISTNELTVEYNDYTESEKFNEIPKEFIDKETYQFSFVGILIVKGIAIIVYPKYIRDIQLDKFNNYKKFRQIFKVIYQYQKRQEQQIYLSTDNFINNENILSVAIQLLNYYGEYGLYNIGKTLIEVNGDGEINWFKTINEMSATLSGNSPVYIDYYTEKNITDTQNMIRQIQLAVLTDIKEKYSDLLSLLDYDISFEDEIFLSDLGDEESFLYYLDKELMIQFISHKIELIKLLKMYIQSKTRENNVDTISVFGVTKFDRVWEDVCKVVYEDNLEHSLIDLNLKYKNTYENNIKLKEFVPKPTWTNLIDGKEYSTLKSLELDTLHVNKETKTFEIYDAKYYLISFANNKINGQPGVSDITKQYLYELTYKDLAEENGYSFINRFIVPIDNKQQDNQLIAKASFSIFDMYDLSDIVVIARDCETIYEQYLSKV